MVFNMLPLAWCKEHGGHAAAAMQLPGARLLLSAFAACVLLTGCLGR